MESLLYKLSISEFKNLFIVKAAKELHYFSFGQILPIALSRTWFYSTSRLFIKPLRS